MVVEQKVHVKAEPCGYWSTRVVALCPTRCSQTRCFGLKCVGKGVSTVHCFCVGTFASPMGHQSYRTAAGGAGEMTHECDEVTQFCLSSRRALRVRGGICVPPLSMEPLFEEDCPAELRCATRSRPGPTKPPRLMTRRRHLFPTIGPRPLKLRRSLWGRVEDCGFPPLRLSVSQGLGRQTSSSSRAKLMRHGIVSLVSMALSHDGGRGCGSVKPFAHRWTMCPGVGRAPSPSPSPFAQAQAFLSTATRLTVVLPESPRLCAMRGFCWCIRGAALNAFVLRRKTSPLCPRSRPPVPTLSPPPKGKKQRAEQPRDGVHQFGFAAVERVVGCGDLDHCEGLGLCCVRVCAVRPLMCNGVPAGGGWVHSNTAQRRDFMWSPPPPRPPPLFVLLWSCGALRRSQSAEDDCRVGL